MYKIDRRGGGDWGGLGGAKTRILGLTQFVLFRVSLG